ncbi:MAG TPA: hypothetical protein VGG13_00950 [Candidatus Saccharimonadales bacterium]|jgi:hypothetical protein
MSNHQTPHPESLQQGGPAETANVPPERERSLRLLLDGPYAPMRYGNYEHAINSGLVDTFYYDTGYDGVEHILSGNIMHGDDNEQVVGGFHHEPSGAFVPADTAPSSVDRTHLDGANKSTRRTFREYPFEPYRARATVRGHRKFSGNQYPNTGETTRVEANNSMFPKEYDSLMVLQAVRIAYETRDHSKDQVRDDGLAILAEGAVPMADNQTPMKIRLVIEIKTGKVAAAYPETIKGGSMRLEEDDIKNYLYGSGSSQRVEG